MLETWNDFLKSHFRDSPEPLLSFNQGGRFLTSPFVPSAISMDPATGRVYHPASDKVGGVGLVADKLSILWTKVSYLPEAAISFVVTYNYNAGSRNLSFDFF